MATAKEVLDTARSWVGKNERDGSHKSIIDLYNTQKPLPRGYPLKYTDDWCAATVSALAVQNHCTDIMPTECSCPKMAAKYRSMGRWREKGYTPNPGDVIFYDWKANHGDEDHVGIVESVSGTAITTIEGNYHDSVERRHISTAYKYIRGYGLPDYETQSQSNGRWSKDARGWYYTEDGKRIKNKWVKDSHDWCYLDADGYAMTNGWAKDSHGWLYLGPDARIIRDAYAYDSAGAHYIDKNGYMKV